MNAGPGSYTTVPALDAGVTTEDQARELLAAQGLEGTPDTEFSDDAPSGTVFAFVRSDREVDWCSPDGVPPADHPQAAHVPGTNRARPA